MKKIYKVTQVAAIIFAVAASQGCNNDQKEIVVVPTSGGSGSGGNGLSGRSLKVRGGSIQFVGGGGYLAELTPDMAPYLHATVDSAELINSSSNENLLWIEGGRKVAALANAGLYQDTVCQLSNTDSNPNSRFHFSQGESLSTSSMMMDPQTGAVALLLEKGLAIQCYNPSGQPVSYDDVSRALRGVMEIGFSSDSEVTAVASTQPAPEQTEISQPEAASQAVPLCSSFEQQNIKIHQKCQTSKGGIYERVSARGRAWKGPDGVIWIDKVQNGGDNFENAVALCKAMKTTLPSQKDFENAEATGFRELLQSLKPMGSMGTALWSTTDNGPGTYYIFNTQDGSGFYADQSLNYSVMCVHTN